MKASTTRWLTAGLTTAAALGACALFVQKQGRLAEAAHPPRGRFVTVDGVRLHFTVRGSDDAEQTVVLLHGFMTQADDFEISGLVEQAAQRYRVIAFDRPGYGWSERPPGRSWSPREQAQLILAALSRLGVLWPIVLGHSLGTMVALEMALDRPEAVGALVLVSGYYFPSGRPSVPVIALRATPIVGTLLRHTVWPLVERAMWPLMVRRMFWPSSVPPRFKREFPLGLMLRPSQLLATGADGAWLVPGAALLRKRYGRLQVPAVVVCGTRDLVAWGPWHSHRVAQLIERGWLRVVENAGHMVHHVATAQVLAAIHQAGAMAREAQQAFPAGLKTGQEEPVPLSSALS